MLAITRPIATIAASMSDFDADHELERVVVLKQSGELLNEGARRHLDGNFEDLTPIIFTPEGITTNGNKIATLARKADSLSISGIVVVSGAGNIARGQTLKDVNVAGDDADGIGRAATILNVAVINNALRNRKIEAKTFIAASMQFGDAKLGVYQPWEVEAAVEAMEEGAVVLVAGGTGEDNVTSDYAVVRYGHILSSFFDEHRAHPPVVEVLKGTKHDGVFEEDPEKNANARQFSVISAGQMLRDNLTAMDEASLEYLQANGGSVRVFADKIHDLPHVLHPSNINGAGVGTLVLGEEVDAVFADEL